VTIDRAPGPVGFHLDVGFGQTMDMIAAFDRAPNAFKYFQQAYVDVKPKSWKGVELDFGKFVTSAGAEVINTNQNFNYSRSVLFAWAIPYYHFGGRLTVPIGPHFTGGVQVVQGWNNVYDNNSGKTLGFTGTYAWKKVSWANVFYIGPEKSKTNKGIRSLYDTVVTINPNDKWSYYLNFDYGHDGDAGAGSSTWTGIAGAVKRTLSPKWAISGRAEYFGDLDGFSTGVKQNVSEITLTGEYKMTGWLMSRFEFRNDWSNKPFFETNGNPAKSQPTVLLGLIAYVAPKK
jgi:hypothetical protein